MTKIDFSGDAVRKLAEILVETDLTEIEYEENGCRIYVSRQQQFHPPVNHVMPVAAPQVATPATAPLGQAPAQTTPSDFHTHPGVVKSLMVGTVYLSPEPSAPPLVKVGDTVTAGQTLVIVEAMKVMNPIKAPKAGTVTTILVSDASPVEFDQPLVIIE
jgi:acetyl-CoA carboxylase biotin carboxyl carrier protein